MKVIDPAYDQRLIIDVEEAAVYPSIDAFVTRAMREYNDLREERLRPLVEAYGMERVSLVTFKECEHCRGIGWVTGIYQVVDTSSRYLRISDCPECPGVCVDGKPIVHRKPPGTDLLASDLDTAFGIHPPRILPRRTMIAYLKGLRADFPGITGMLKIMIPAFIAGVLFRLLWTL